MGNSRSHEKKPQHDHNAEDNPDCHKKANRIEVLYKKKLEKMKNGESCGLICAKILFILLAIATVINSLAVIIVAASTAFATKIYSSDLSGRLVAMIILAVTAAIALCIAIYAIVGVSTKKVKPLYASALVLFTLAIIQAILSGISLRIYPSDEATISRSLVESFKLARENNPRHLRIWTTTESDLNCCGVYSPEDYRTPRMPIIFPPDVPISCCPTYSPDRSSLVQERERETCKARKEYFDIGCKSLVIEVLRESSTIVLGVTIPMIIFEVILSIFSGCLSREKKPSKKKAMCPPCAEDGVASPNPS
ncbi:23 kDa integral membrane protein-like isoform X2 [Hyposmocoma kahamanoa]|uniref:23 kDa integral membrane protein-like isoform X2 n=1 Tax=Hyposmocoma kahamanoa TaxID=1477025 RepID=UPI000E6D81FE|nr:23 kDa integral membrane protein-like isoform X2 [Hyposmocoma kahamanoa]